MSAPKHTPGPWAVSKIYRCEVEAPCGNSVATCWDERHADGRFQLCDTLRCPPEESAANAALIAAAPDLKSELADAVAIVECWSGSTHFARRMQAWLDGARAALAKAERRT